MAIKTERNPAQVTQAIFSNFLGLPATNTMTVAMIEK